MEKRVLSAQAFSQEEQSRYKEQTFPGGNIGRMGDALGGPSGPSPSQETRDTADGELRAADMADLGREGTDPRGCQHRAWRRARAGVIESQRDNTGLRQTQSSVLPAPPGHLRAQRGPAGITRTRAGHARRAPRSSVPREHRPSGVTSHARGCGPAAPHHTRGRPAQPAPTCLRRANGNGSSRPRPRPARMNGRAPPRPF